MSAIWVHRKLISICQITHVCLCFDSNYVMSEALLVDISKKETQEQNRIEDASSIVLSEYAKKLESHIRTRHLKKRYWSRPRVFTRREVRCRMSATDRSHRSSLLSCAGNQLLYFQAVQGFQESRELQSNGIGLRNERPRKNHWK